LQCVNRELTTNNFDAVLNLIQCMMPNLDNINQIVAN